MLSVNVHTAGNDFEMQSRQILYLFVHLWFFQSLQLKIRTMASHIADECFLGFQHDTEVLSHRNRCQLVITSVVALA